MAVRHFLRRRGGAVKRRKFVGRLLMARRSRRSGRTGRSPSEAISSEDTNRNQVRRFFAPFSDSVDLGCARVLLSGKASLFNKPESTPDLFCWTLSECASPTPRVLSLPCYG